MQVFKTYMKLLWRTLPVVMVYLILFALLLVVMSKASTNTTDYTDVSLSISVYDEDESAASQAFYEYLDENYKIVSIPQDENLILDALFNASIDYAIVINEGFEEKLAAGETEELFRNYQDTNASSGVIIDAAVDQYVKTVCAYQMAGMSTEAAIEKTAEALSNEIKVTKETFSEANTGEISTTYAFFFQFFSYIIVSVFMNSACPVLLKMNSSDIKKRVNSSSVSQSSQTLQVMLGSAVVFFGVWLILNIIGIFVGGGSIGKMSMLAILNSFVFTLVAAGLTLLCTAFIREQRVVNLISNIVGLGMSFLCGGFVPQQMLSDSVLTVARFLPAYWYIRTNDMLAGISGEIFSNTAYLSYIGIQLLFAAFLFISFILVSRIRYKEEGL